MSTAPLAGMRVLDLTTTVSGPTATLRLAQYGADVIKIEAPDGDVLRSLGGSSPTGAHSGQFLHLNRGKSCVSLDLRQAAAGDAARAILATCDVLVTNMRQPALVKLGFDAETTRARDPRLVHCTISGFGPEGAYSGRPAYDSIIQGAAGLAGLSIARDGDARFVPLLICDHVVGEIAAGAVLAALVERDRTGKGGAIEVPMHETMAAFVLHEHLSRATFVPPIGAAGDQRVLNPAMRPVQTSDGWITVTANTDDQCRRFLRVAQQEHLLDDPRFRTVADRVENMAAWLLQRDTFMLGRTSRDWLDDFAAADVPAMPCHTLETLMQDPHLASVDMIIEENHPTDGAILAIRSSVLYDGKPARLGGSPGRIGRDTLGVLTSVGCSKAECAALIASGAAIAP